MPCSKKRCRASTVCLVKSFIFTVFLAENASTVLFFSSRYKTDLQRNFNVGIDERWAQGLLILSVILKLYSIGFSRLDTLFGQQNDLPPSSNDLRKISRFVHSKKSLLVGEAHSASDALLGHPVFQDPSSPTPDSSIAILKPRFARFLKGRVTPELLIQWQQQMSSDLNGPGAPMTLSSYYSCLLLGFFDACAALVPGGYYGVLAAYTMGVRNWNYFALSFSLGLISKIPCSIVYFLFRVPTNAEFTLWMRAFSQHGFVRKMSVGFLFSLCLSLMTAVSDASTVYYPTVYAMAFMDQKFSHANCSTDAILSPPIESQQQRYVTVTASLCSILYGITSFGNTLSTTFPFVFSKPVRCSVSSFLDTNACTQVMPKMLGLLNLFFCFFNTLFSLMTVERHLFGYDASESLNDGCVVAASFFALMSTYKSLCFSYPRLLEAAKRFNPFACMKKKDLEAQEGSTQSLLSGSNSAGGNEV